MKSAPPPKYLTSITGEGTWRVTYEDGKIIGVELWEKDDTTTPSAALSYEVLDIKPRR